MVADFTQRRDLQNATADGLRWRGDADRREIYRASGGHRRAERERRYSANSDVPKRGQLCTQWYALGSSGSVGFKRDSTGSFVVGITGFEITQRQC